MVRVGGSYSVGDLMRSEGGTSATSFMSSCPSSQPATSRFWAMRASEFVEGITATPCCTAQRSRTCAGDFPLALAARVTPGAFSAKPPCRDPPSEP